MQQVLAPTRRKCKMQSRLTDNTFLLAV